MASSLVVVGLVGGAGERAHVAVGRNRAVPGGQLRVPERHSDHPVAGVETVTGLGRIVREWHEWEWPTWLKVIWIAAAVGVGMVLVWAVWS